MIKKIILYMFGTFFSKLIVFIMLPIYTAKFDPGSYGEIDLLMTTVIMLVSVSFLDIWQYVLRYTYNSSDLDRKKVVSNTVTILIPLILLFSVLILFLSYLIPNLYSGYLIIYGIGYLLMNIYQFYCRGIGRNNLFVFSGIASNVLEVILNLILILLFKLGPVSILVSAFIGRFVVISFMEIKVKLLRDVNFSLINRERFMHLISFSLPLGINSLAFWGMNSLNRVLSYDILGSVNNGYLSVIVKFTSIFTVFVSVIVLAWQEIAYENYSSKNRKTTYSKYVNQYLVFSAILMTGIMFATLIAFKWIVDEQYWNAYSLIPISFVAVYFNGVSAFSGPLYAAENKTKTLFYSSLIGAIVNIIVLYIFIGRLGVVVVPVSLMAGFMINSISRYLVLVKYNVLKIDYKKILIAIIIISASFVYSINLTGLYSALIGFVMFALLPILIFFGKEIKVFVFSLFAKRGVK